MHKRFLGAALAAAIFLLLPIAGLASNQAAPSPPGQAVFEGHTIDLSKGWGDAHACLVANGAGVVECFRDQAGLLARESQLQEQASADPAIAASTCSTPLRLYADTGYGGRELDFYDRGYWQNLSDWSFDNQTSSYKVGACGVYLADGANGGGSWYPGNTNAGASASSMVSGWNDRISSLYIQ
ncbi:MAG TPA: hypothetical protein VFW41_07675 [Gaiellaceae bacterium]|nr:hypothetical protein [Gaiellaceae bacterium]